MKKREFQVFVKPVGAACNLGCSYCYYLEKEQLYDGEGTLQMTDAMLEKYIRQHMEASTEETVLFSWHGGEPLMAGIDFYRKAVTLQRKYVPEGKRVVNGIQTNGTLLNEDWCEFLREEKFIVGISMDGPAHIHDGYRLTKNGKPSFDRVLHGYELLRKHGVVTEILCVVNSSNAREPLQVYRFFKGLGAKFITFLPLVDKVPGERGRVTASSVRAEDFGRFMIAIFDEWVEHDIGKVKVQLFEEAARTAFHQDHTLCIFKRTCGGVPVVEHNGDFYSCDHFVDAEHLVGNLSRSTLSELLDSDAQRSFGRAKQESLPEYCLQCEVLDMCNGECPKNRFIKTPDGEAGLNYLCAGYRQFFNHCKPFVETLAAVWENRQKQGRASVMTSEEKPGRNDPCPCGSGRKYKHCCGRN